MYRRTATAPSHDLCLRIAEVFRTHGYVGASIAAIAESAGLSKASLYHHFPGGKEEMAKALTEYGIALAAASVFSPLESSASPLERLNAMLEGYLEHTSRGARPCLLMVLGQSAPETQRKRIAQQLKAWQMRVESALCELRNVKPKKAARLAEETLCSLYGGTLLVGLLKDPLVLERTIKRLRRTFEAQDI
jgi:AcrR family transcriptional regulator